MKKLLTLILFLCGFTLFPSTVSHAEVNPQEIVAGTTVPETVLVDRDGVKITAKGLSLTSDSDPTINLSINIQNTRDEDLSISPGDFTINSFQVFVLEYFDVPKQSNADYEIEVDMEEFEMYQIEHIMTIGLRFDVSKTDHKTIFESEEVSFVTSAYGQYVQQYNFSGTSIYDKDNIKITVLPQITEGYSGLDILFYIENNAEYDVVITDVYTVYANHKTVDSYLFAYVDAGKKSIESLTIEWRDLAKNGIMNIKSVIISLEIRRNDGFPGKIDILRDINLSF